MTIRDLFRDEPTQWGLRGDPFLWRELAEFIGGRALPASAAEFRTILENAYEGLTGYPITHEKSFKVERFKSHGMSSGSVHPKFWQERGFPLLMERFQAARPGKESL